MHNKDGYIIAPFLGVITEEIIQNIVWAFRQYLWRVGIVPYNL